MVDGSLILTIAPLQWSGILACVASGFLVGLERQLRGKPVGIRTSSLIVLGTYVFIILAQSVNTEATDTSRIIGQVVTGIGFLGAGVMLAKDGTVLGVTSAATIWALAAVGISIAVASPWVGIKLALLVVVILVGVDVLENTFSSLTRGVHARYSAWRQRR